MHWGSAKVVSCMHGGQQRWSKCTWPDSSHCTPGLLDYGDGTRFSISTLTPTHYYTGSATTPAERPRERVATYLLTDLWKPGSPNLAIHAQLSVTEW